MTQLGLTLLIDSFTKNYMQQGLETMWGRGRIHKVPVPARRQQEIPRAMIPSDVGGSNGSLIGVYCIENRVKVAVQSLQTILLMPSFFQTILLMPSFFQTILSIDFQVYREDQLKVSK